MDVLRVKLKLAALSLFLLVCLTSRNCMSASYHQASRRSRIPHSYIVHLHPTVTPRAMQSLIDDLHALDRDEREADFEARVRGTLTLVTRGFTAKLSKRAVQKV